MDDSRRYVSLPEISTAPGNVGWLHASVGAVESRDCFASPLSSASLLGLSLQSLSYDAVQHVTRNND